MFSKPIILSRIQAKIKEKTQFTTDFQNVSEHSFMVKKVKFDIFYRTPEKAEKLNF